MEIVLIRHGQPEWMPGDVYTKNPGLTSLGKQQSEKSSSEFEENSVDEIWVSPLKRAQETFAPFKEKNIVYLYCVSKYPTSLTEIDMPNFENSFFKGFSDHTIGISSCIYAASRGAEYLEKHFSNNKSLNVNTQQAHVCSMDFNDLINLRHHCDSVTLLRSK